MLSLTLCVHVYVCVVCVYVRAYNLTYCMGVLYNMHCVIFCNVHIQITGCIVLLALAVYTRSPAAYEALRNFKLLQLPSVRSLKFYIDANLESAGDSIPRLKESRKQYLELVAEKKNEVDMSTGTCTCTVFTLDTKEGPL